MFGLSFAPEAVQAWGIVIPSSELWSREKNHLNWESLLDQFYPWYIPVLSSGCLAGCHDRTCIASACWPTLYCHFVML